MISINPVLGREVRERMRTGRAFAIVGVFLAMLVLTVFLVYQGNTTSGDLSFDLSRQSRLGRDLYEWLLLVMTLLVLLFVPGLTAGAIAGERERQTLLPLQVTLLRPRSIVVGKVLAGASFLVLLLVASLPVLVVSYMLGGINLVDSLRGLGVVLFVAVSLTVMIAAISAMIRRVQTATLVAYTFVALLVVIAPLVYLTLGVIDAGSGDDKVNPPAVVLTVNPLVVVADASAGVNVTNADTPMSGIAQGLAEAKELTSDKWFTWFPDDRLDNQFDDVNGVQRTGFPGWAIGMMALSVLAFVMALGGERRLRTPAETER